MFFIDTETRLMTPGDHAPPFVVINVNGTILHHADRQARQCVEAMLGASAPIVAHYAAFDMCAIGSRYPDLIPSIFAKYDRGEITCTIVREKLIDIYQGTRDGARYALDHVAKRRARIDVDKSNPWRLRFGKFEEPEAYALMPNEARDYLLGDVACLPAIFAAQEAAGAPLANQWLQARDDFGFAVTSAYGLMTDPVKVARLDRVVRTAHEHLSSYLIREGLLSPKRKRDPEGEQKRNTKVAAEIMLAIKGDAAERTPSGAICLDEVECSSSGDPRLIAYGRYSSLNTVLTKDVPLLQRGIIHARFDSLLATGRTSTSPNTQNLKVKQYESGICKCGRWEQDHHGPERSCEVPICSLAAEYVYRPTETVGVRECITPRPGHVFIIADFGGLELATWARVCLDWLGFSDMAEALRAGRDPHLIMAADILSESYDQCVAGLKSEKAEGILSRYYNARQSGKVGNFGCPGGLGARSLVAYAFANYGVVLSIDDARRIIEAWRRNYREAKPYLARISDLTKAPAPKITQVRSGRVRGLDPQRAYTQAGNTMFQGLGADLAKDAHYHVTREAYCCPASPLYGARPVLFVHDETGCEAREDRASDACERMATVMVDRARHWLDDVPIKVEPLITRVYSKQAQTRRDANGRLIEWVA